MARRPLNPLAVMHSALSDDTSRNILARLSADDMSVLSGHIKAGTLMNGLQPLLDNETKSGAVNAMSQDLGNVVRKIPAEHLNALKEELQKLPVGQNNSRDCGC